MQILFDRLDEEQKRIVYCEDKAILVEGVVGSGKTDTLIAKILHLIYDKGVSAKKILVLGFNHNTVKVIRQRLQQYIPKDNQEMPMPIIYNFDEWFVRLLRYESQIRERGLHPNFSVCNEKENNLFFPQRPRRDEQIEDKKKREKNRDIFLRQLGLDHLTENKEPLLQKLNTLFFNDLATYANKRQYTNVPEWIFIDEIQNVEIAKHLNLVLQFYQKGASVVFLGDFNQKIYPLFKPKGKTYRDLSDELRTFLIHRVQPTVLILSVNYRSAPVIVNAAKPFMFNNVSLSTYREDAGPKIVVQENVNRNYIGNMIAGDIENLHSNGIPYSDMAVLVKDRYDRDYVKGQLDEEQIPIYGNRGNNGEVKALEWLVHLLLFSINPNDLFAKYDISDAANTLSQQINGFQDWSRSSITKIEGLGEEIFRYFGLESQIIDPKLERREPVLFRMFLHDMEEFCRTSGEGDFRRGIVAYLTICRLDREKLQEIIEQDRDSVRLLTFHTANGLEFKHVWMYGDFGKNEDEESLFYVGLTRASETVTLLSKASDNLPNGNKFINRIPKNLIQTEEICEQTSTIEQTSYIGRKCTHWEYGEGIVTEQNTQGLVIFYQNYAGGHTVNWSLDEAAWIYWTT